MKVNELRERLAMDETNSQSLSTGRLVAYIIDGLEEINMLAETHIDVQRIDITKDKRFYEFPKDTLKVIDVRVKNHLNSKDEYRSVPRLTFKPRVHDTDEV
tara:strand:- start:49 stop:351 length:303 start_codon:yes stop_codon:yes gene_type:complete